MGNKTSKKETAVGVPLGPKWAKARSKIQWDVAEMGDKILFAAVKAGKRQCEIQCNFLEYGQTEQLWNYYSDQDYTVKRIISGSRTDSDVLIVSW